MPYDALYRGQGPVWWVGGMLWMLLFWGVVIILVLFAVKHFGRTHEIPSNEAAAIDALKMRFARGEINEDEFQRGADLLKHTR